MCYSSATHIQIWLFAVRVHSFDAPLSWMCGTIEPTTSRHCLPFKIFYEGVDASLMIIRKLN